MMVLDTQQNSGADGSSYYDISINGNIVSCNDVIYDLDKAAYFTAREAARHG